jgi:protein-S-isoprenylcysteine O-methyltransferase Ste14
VKSGTLSEDLQKRADRFTGGPMSDRAATTSGLIAGLSIIVFGFVIAFFLFVASVGFWQSRVEERLLMETFPEQYPEYRRRVKALIPGVL